MIRDENAFQKKSLLSKFTYLCRKNMFKMQWKNLWLAIFNQMLSSSLDFWDQRITMCCDWISIWKAENKDASAWSDQLLCSLYLKCSDPFGGEKRAANVFKAQSETPQSYFHDPTEWHSYCGNLGVGGVVPMTRALAMHAWGLPLCCAGKRQIWKPRWQFRKAQTARVQWETFSRESGRE